MTDEQHMEDIIIDDVAKKKIKSHLRTKEAKEELENAKAENYSQFISHNIELFKIARTEGRIDKKDPRAIEQRIMEYLSVCEKNNVRPTLEGLSLSMGYDRKIVYEMRNGTCGSEIAEVTQLIASLCNSVLVDSMMNNKINPVTGIFLCKNNHGYTDKTEISVSPSNPLGEETSEKLIEERYATVIDTTGKTTTEE